ncbi:MAG: DsrE family protein [Alkalilacustris sp.]
MRPITTTLLALVLAVASLAMAPRAMAADAPHHFLFSITTDESWAAGSALTQASIAAESGHAVTVLLSVRGIYLAHTKSVQGGFSVTGQSPRYLLARLIEKGHDVLVCGVCLVAGGIEAEDLVPGAKISGPELMLEAMTRPNTVALSY